MEREGNNLVLVEHYKHPGNPIGVRDGEKRGEKRRNNKKKEKR